MIAREGLNLILLFVIVGVALSIIGLLAALDILLFLAIADGLITLFLLYFFRDPERAIPSGADLVVSPSDGRVLAIESALNSEFVGSDSKKISIFLSPLDVHVIRSPIQGQIKYSRYHRGAFKAAYRKEASLENENLELGIENNRGRLILRQIAGVLARRIVCHAKELDKLQKGTRLGVIKFGSRVELILPRNVDVKVKTQDRVKAGETVIGVFQ